MVYSFRNITLLDLIRKCAGLLDEYDQKYDHPDWQVSSEDQKNDLIIW